MVERFGELCERAEPAASSWCWSSCRSSPIGTLADAVGVVEEVGHPNGAVLVDTLHLARSGGIAGRTRGVSPRLLPYLQVADAPAEPPARRGELRDEALHGRLLPGEGALPLDAALAAVPGVPLSLELRSATLMTRFPDPLERAVAGLAAAGDLIPGALHERANELQQYGAFFGTQRRSAHWCPGEIASVEHLHESMVHQ